MTSSWSPGVERVSQTGIIILNFSVMISAAALTYGALLAGVPAVEGVDHRHGAADGQIKISGKYLKFFQRG